MLKGQVNSFNLILGLASLTVLLYYFKKWKAVRILSVCTFLIFIVLSTGYIPRYLVSQLEYRYTPFNPSSIVQMNDTLYIQVLGGGYSLDRTLPANSMLSQVSIGRLVEGIRIARLFRNSILVLSGTSENANESLASVGRRAAITLGFDSTRVELLENPTTTQQEAEAFVERYGKGKRLVLVTDAIHMPRSVGFFLDQGIHVYPAPTNYLVKNELSSINFKWIPSVENFLMMDRVIREFFGGIKRELKGD